MKINISKHMQKRYSQFFQVVEEKIDYILNKDCNGILFNFDNNELYLIEDCNDLLEDM